MDERSYLLIESVKRAYAATGLRPGYGSYVNHDLGCACPVGVLMQERGLLSASSANKNDMLEEFGISHNYLNGVIQGYEAAIKFKQSNTEAQTQFDAGYEVGRILRLELDPQTEIAKEFAFRHYWTLLQSGSLARLSVLARFFELAA